jgi:hypothetical protein
MAEDYIINVKVQGTNQVKSQIEDVGKSASKTGKLAGLAMGPLDQVFGGLPSKLMAARKGVQGLNLSFKGMKAAIMSSGIGILVVALGEIIANWEAITDAIGVTSEAARQLEQDQKQLNATMVAATAATQPYLDIINDTTQSIENRRTAHDQLSKVVEAAKGIDIESADGMQRLADATRDYVAQQTLQQQLAQVNEKIAGKEQEILEQKTKWYNWGLNAEGKAAQLEKQRQKIRESMQPLEKERNRIIQNQIQLQNKLNKELEDQREAEKQKRLDDEAAAKAEREAEARRQRLAQARRERLNREEQAIARREKQAIQTNMTEEELFLDELERQEQAELATVKSEEAKAAIREFYAQKFVEYIDQLNDKEQERQDKIDADQLKNQQAVTEALNKQRMSAREVEQADLETHYDKLHEQAEGNAELQLEVETERLNARAALQKKFDDEDSAARQAKSDKDLAKAKADLEAEMALRTEFATNTFSILSNLNEAFSKKGEEQSKKSFERTKAISIAETLVSTYLSAQAAFASQFKPLATIDSPIRGALAAGAAVAGGLARVAAIKSQQYSGGGGAGGAGVTGGGFSGGATSVGVDVGSLIPNQQTPTPEPVRAYVVSNEISNRQALDRELQIQTTL